MRRLLCILVVFAGSVVGAQPTTDATLTEATRLIGEGEFERALKKLDATVSRTKEAADVARLHLARGQCLLALGKRDQAREAFSLALKSDLTIALPEHASPDAAVLFERARAAFPATISVTVNVAASIRIGDRSLGPAPLTTQVEPGTLEVEAKTSDGRSSRKSIELKPGGSVTINLEIAALPAPREPAPPPLLNAEPLQPPAVERSRVGWIPLGAGVVVAAAGGISLWQAGVHYDRLTNSSLPPLSAAAVSSTAGAGSTLQTLGWVGVGLGGAAVAAGAVMLVLPPPQNHGPVVTLWITPGGATVGVTGALP